MMGTAHSMTGWGAFFDIGEGIRGLLHVDEMIWPEGNYAPSAFDCMKEGDQAEVSLPAITACRSLGFMCIMSLVRGRYVAMWITSEERVRLKFSKVLNMLLSLCM